jgi:hypothetical protein
MQRFAVRPRTPKLDFIVIGAQKSGTTSLWRYLSDNPRLRMPPDKEASFFSEPSYPDQLRPYMRALFKHAPARARLGTVTPIYMHGTAAAPVPVIADRIRETVPRVKLVALLRDPVERARSAHRMLVRRSVEHRSFEEAVRELLSARELQRARREPSEITSYVVAGEYGRILATYLERFPRDQLHIELSGDLESNPRDVVDRVCSFIGVEPHVPRDLGRRYFPSGPRRVTPEAEADLMDYLDVNVWPRVRHSTQHRESFERWFELWNVEPDEPAQPVDAAIASLLREHYAEDAELLERMTGVRAAWAPR